MYGRRLATVEEIIALVSPDCDEELSTLEEWADDHDIPVHVVDVGDDIDPVYSPEREFLGVTLGGDGTYLEGVRQFSPKQIPILGVNAGTLAFLASISPDELTDALDETIRGGASVDRRQQLQVEADGVDCTGINDVMIEHEPPENPVDRKITRLQVFADGEFVGEYEGSGLAVATPTGSTGVSLSAGGPVHFPVNNSSLQVVPLQTHRMGVRPLVVDADTTVEVVAEGPANLLVDGGRSHAELEEEDVVTISGADTSALVVNTSYDDDFFTSISEKLGWSVREDRHDRGDARLVGGSETDHGDDVVRRAKQVAEDAAKAAGEALRELHGQTESVEYKSDKSDIVTEADYKADNIITTVVENEFPDHGIRSEESDERVGSSDYTWLIDPLDGTGNFAHGNPNYSISIALLEDEEPVMGVVYAPETDEMFAAIEGEGATLDGMPISTTDRSSLDECMLLSGYDPDGAFLSHCYQETRGVRSLGSAALSLCYLASGSADALWEYDTYPWDVAAGIVIAREAGATVTNADGDPYDPIAPHDARAELVGSNGPVHEALLRHLEDEQDLQTAERTSAD
ncbi:inositol monophosphatase [Halostella sp. JP-L12]|uniref:NAD(+)/NADH kinase n=1 Tax=Halostella TaxID=1843185 RepID=UPI000EF77979|nr:MULTISPECIES: inositol monophosphatase family protein [Halostella]NHN49505.1 inositol monophosphatase [Halostella sp. JP-L12]